jgi:hypothetical protein
MTWTRFSPAWLAAVALVGLVLAAGASAFTASNTLPATNAGDGSSPISGYTVSNVTYTLDSTSTKIDIINFHLANMGSGTTQPSTVKASVDNGTTWVDCTTSNFASGAGDYACDYAAGNEPTLASASTLRVVAAN